jgi:hypothetical protein
MSHIPHRLLTTLGAGAALLAFGARAAAQNLLQASAQVVAGPGVAVPGVPGATFTGAGGSFDTPVLDAAGNVMFRAQFTGGGATSADDRALFHGGPATLVLLARGGAQAPGLPAGVTLSTPTGTPGFTSVYRLGPAGHTLWVSGVWNGGTTTADDSAIFAGLPASQTVLVRKGDLAPGTVGATFSTSFNMGTTTTTGVLAVNSAGQYLFRSFLSGGDVSGSLNNQGWWLGTPGGLQLLARSGDMAPGPGGFVFGSLVGPATPFVCHLNAAGQVLWECQYSTGSGTPAATSADDQVLFLSTLGGNHTLIAREGDPAPGLGGTVLYGASGGLSTWGATATNLDGSGNVLFKADLREGGTTTDNDQAIFYRPAGGPTALVFRENDPAPGLPGVMLASTFNSTLQLNANGRYPLVMTLRGAGVSPSNDSSLWSGLATAPASLALVGREGDPAPGTAGALYGSFSTNVLAFNNLDQMVFQVSLTGGDVVGTTNDQALYLWTPTSGAALISRKGDALTQLGGATLSSWTVFQNNNTENSNLGFNNSGLITLRLGLGGGTQAIVVLDVGASTGTVFCPGDGSGTACPCGNNSMLGAGEGCLTSFAVGGKLRASGIASLSADTLVLAGSQMPNAPGLYFQGMAQVNGGVGSLFGDGLRCAGGTVVRLTQEVPVSGMSQYPALGDQPVSVQGLVHAPGTRTYQIWFRNNAPFCTPDGWNLTNGVEIDWQP